MKKYIKDVVYICIIGFLLVGLFSDFEMIKKEEKCYSNEYGSAKVEYVHEENQGYKFVEEDFWLFDQFDFSNMKETKETFDEPWIYRITFNWNSPCYRCEEKVVLVGETSVSVDGVKYIPENDTALMKGVLESIDYSYRTTSAEVEYEEV